MKRTLISLVSIVAMSVFFGSFANADLTIPEVFDSHNAAFSDTYSKILTKYGTGWWYSSSDAIFCDSKGNGFTVNSPVVADSFLYNADVYRLFVSPYRVSQLKDGGSEIDVSKVIMKEFNLKTNSDSSRVTFDLSASDGLDSNQIYYGFLIQINMYDEIWTPSSEFCFQLEKNMCVRDEACDTIELVINPVEETNNTEENTEEHGAAPEDTTNTEEEQHNAACIWMNLANITHTISSDNTITLKWTSLWDNSIVQIGIFDPDEEIYKALWAVNMDDEKFEYKMKWDGEQNFSLTNGCKDVYYKVDAKRKTSEPEKIVPTRVGPAENILYVVIAAVVLYGAYVLLFRKAENK